MAPRSTRRRGGPLTVVLLASTATLLAVAGLVTRAPAVSVASGAPAAHPASPAAVAPRPIPGPATPVLSGPLAGPPAGGGQEPVTARSFLAGYYGDRWPEIARAIEATGLDLDQPYVFTPWEEVVHHFAVPFGLDKEVERESAAWAVRYWPDELDAHWLSERFGVDAGSIRPDDLAAIEALAADHNALLDANAAEWVAGIELHLAERWASGEYFKAPFTTMGLYTEQGFFTTATAGYGWAVAAVLKREEYPDMVVIEHRAAELREQRDDLIARYLYESR